MAIKSADTRTGMFSADNAVLTPGIVYEGITYVLEVNISSSGPYG